MRRFLPALLIFWLLLPSVLTTKAQENQLVFADLDQTFEVTDLQMQFNYPTGWVFDTSNGIALAENETDLAALIDDDTTTNPVGYTLRLVALPLEAMELQDATLEEVVETVVSFAQLTVSEQVETPVLAHRGITVLGVDPTNEAGIATLWIQDGLVVVFSMGVPGAEVTSDEGFTWGFILGAAAPLTDIEFDEPIQINKAGGFTITYPSGWLTGENADLGAYFFELQSDLDNALAAGDLPTLEGWGILTESFTLAELNLTPENTPTDVIQRLIDGGVIVDPFNRSDYVLLDQPAVGLEFVDQASGNSLLLVTGIVGDQVLMLVAGAPTPETMPPLKPIFLTMLKSMAPVQ